MANPDEHPESLATLMTRTKDAPWYVGELRDGDIWPECRELLQKYSGIPADQVDKHVFDVVRLIEPGISCVVHLVLTIKM
jgi:hypothetical protein